MFRYLLERLCDQFDCRRPEILNPACKLEHVVDARRIMVYLLGLHSKLKRKTLAFELGGTNTRSIHRYRATTVFRLENPTLFKEFNREYELICQQFEDYRKNMTDD